MIEREIIADACGRIMGALKEGRFTRAELEFLIKFYKKIVELSEALLREGEVKNDKN